ncbi:MAG: hypothetical protein ACRC33_03830 [Gemmataceae bacterium]
MSKGLNLTIASGATVRVVGANNTLTVSGDLTQNGTIDFQYYNVGWGVLDVTGTATLNSTLTFTEELGAPGMGWSDVLKAGDIVYNNPEPVAGYDYQIVPGAPGKKLQIRKQ